VALDQTVCKGPKNLWDTGPPLTWGGVQIGKNLLLTYIIYIIVWLDGRVVKEPDLWIGRRAAECNPGQVVYTRGFVVKQYNLVPANGRWCSAAGKVTAGLAESNGSLPPGLWLRSPVWDFLTYIIILLR